MCKKSFHTVITKDHLYCALLQKNSAPMLNAICHLNAHVLNWQCTCYKNEAVFQTRSSEFPVVSTARLSLGLGQVGLFTAYFPFCARKFESKGCYKYIHVVAVINSTVVSGFLVGAQLGLGGYGRTVVPIFCLADASSAYAFAIVPTNAINALVLTFVMILHFKVFDIGGWKLKSKVLSLLCVLSKSIHKIILPYEGISIQFPEGTLVEDLLCLIKGLFT